MSISNETYVAVSSYQAIGPGELSISVGDKITIIENVGNDWFRGESSSGDVGIFPSSVFGNQFASNSQTSKQDNYMIVEEDFVAKDVSQLSLKKGDVVKVITKFPTGWFSGELNGRTGVAPQKCLRNMDENEIINPTVHKRSKSQNKNKERTRPATISEKASQSFRDDINLLRKEINPISKAIAKYEYKGDGEGQISFQPGDNIVVLEKLSNGWWKGKIGDSIGFFPGSYVDEQITNEPKPSTSSSLHSSLPQNIKKGVVLYSYIAKSSSELSLTPGDEVIILPSNDPSMESKGWALGSLSKNPEQLGHFPKAYVQIKNDDDDSKSTRDSKKNKRKSQPAPKDRRKSMAPMKTGSNNTQKNNGPPNKPPPAIPKLNPNTNGNHIEPTSKTGEATKSETESPEKFKQALIKLQQQFKTAFEELLGQIENNEKEQQKLEFVMRDLKKTVKEDNQSIQRIEMQNKALYEEIKTIKSQNPSNYQEKLIETINRMGKQLQEEISKRKKLEETVFRLESEIKKLSNTM